jgi:hypothetical protein
VVQQDAEGVQHPASHHHEQPLQKPLSLSVAAR